jgi:hypothetical protein
MTQPPPHRPGKGGGKKRDPTNNRCRIDGNTAFIEVGTKKYPNAECAIDVADLPAVLDGRGKWYARSANGRTIYVTRTMFQNGKKPAVQLHRHLYGLGGGHAVIVDHADGDGLNNRRSSNLRLCDHVKNRANGRACRANKYKGVFLRKNSATYRAIITARGIRFYIGNFKTAEEAAKAYDAAARVRFGKFARTNFNTEGSFDE